MTPGFAYTVATGRLFEPFSQFHDAAEQLLGRPIFTHEFADKATWDDLRAALEVVLTDAYQAGAEDPVPLKKAGERSDA